MHRVSQKNQTVKPSGFGSRARDSPVGSRLSGFGFRISGFESRLSSFGIQIESPRFQIPGSRSQGSISGNPDFENPDFQEFGFRGHTTNLGEESRAA